MSEKIRALVERAAGILMLSKPGAVSASDALRQVGFSDVESSNPSLRRQVNRYKQKLVELSRKNIEKSFANNRKLPPSISTSTPPRPPRYTTVSMSAIKRNKPKKVRMTSNQAHLSRKEEAEKRFHQNQIFKKATFLWNLEQEKEKLANDNGLKYTKVSAETICRELNEKENTTIKPRTVRNAVRDGRVNLTPLKRGQQGSIPHQAFKALCGAFESYVKLASQKGDINISRPRLIQRVNSVVNNKIDENRKGDGLLKRLQKELAGTLDLGEPNKVENRRSKWTTYSNVNIWFDSLKEFLISFGFARGRDSLDDDSMIGEIEFFPGQLHRITSNDESGIVLDNTESARGGRPAMRFFDSYTQESPQQASHKNSYHASGMWAVTLGGLALPPHFILPTDAKSDNQSLPFEFIENMKSVYFDPSDKKMEEMSEEEINKKYFSCTYGMNEKGSMTKEELENYFMNNFSILWPDKADLPGKRICCLIDGGPGRTNPEMLAKILLMGIFLFPSRPPNCTHLLQVMDQLFGFFKTKYYENFDKLWEFRMSLPPGHPQHERVTRNDIGRLIFGDKLPNDSTLVDSFSLSFEKPKVISACKKLGLFLSHEWHWKVRK